MSQASFSMHSSMLNVHSSAHLPCAFFLTYVVNLIFFFFFNMFLRSSHAFVCKFNSIMLTLHSMLLCIKHRLSRWLSAMQSSVLPHTTFLARWVPYGDFSGIYLQRIVWSLNIYILGFSSPVTVHDAAAVLIHYLGKK